MEVEKLLQKIESTKDLKTSKRDLALKKKFSLRKLVVIRRLKI